MYQLCRHLLASGQRCTQPAVAGTQYCRHHGVVKRTVASSILPPKFQHLHRALPFLYPEDRASITANCFLVMRALDDRRISTQTANAMNRLLRTCQANLKQGPLHESESLGAPFPGPPRTGLRSWGGQKRSLSGEEKRPHKNTGAGAPQPALSSPKGLEETWEQSTVHRVVLTPTGEELAPPLEVWEQDEEPHHGESCPCHLCARQYRAAAPEPHHSDCRCGQCPQPAGAGAPHLEEMWDQESNHKPAGAPHRGPHEQVFVRGVESSPAVRLSGEQTEQTDQTSSTDVIPSGVDAEGGNKVEGPAFSPSPENSDDYDDPYASYDGDPIPPDPYDAQESEEERIQDSERRSQIMDKHKDRIARVEHQYMYSSQLADRLRDEIQAIMELEMGPEAFAYQPLQPPAS